MDFSTFSRETLHRYLVHYDLVPMVYPSPLTASDPPPPYSLLEPVRLPTPPPPTLVPVNRPRRDSDIRKRSSRLVDDENGIFGRTAILADIGDIDHMLAKIAERHFRDEVIREVDTLASFMCTLKTNGKLDPALILEQVLMVIFSEDTVAIVTMLCRNLRVLFCLFYVYFYRNIKMSEILSSFHGNGRPPLSSGNGRSAPVGLLYKVD